MIWPIVPPWFPPQTANDWWTVVFLGIILAWIVATLFGGGAK